MRTPRIEDRRLAAGRSERDQVFAEQLEPDRRAIRFRQLLGQERGQPVPPEQIAHRSTWPHLGNVRIVPRAQHARKRSVFVRRDPEVSWPVITSAGPKKGEHYMTS